MSSPDIHVRHARTSDLEAINQVIEAAVSTWRIPERVKRLSLSSYLYTDMDLEHLDIVVAEDLQNRIVGVAAWEQANSKDTPEGHTALLLHGLYIAPSCWQQGIGRRLFSRFEDAARRQHYTGLLVKAQTDASGFFISRGMKKLHIEDTGRHYANRFWKDVKQ